MKKFLIFVCFLGIANIYAQMSQTFDNYGDFEQNDTDSTAENNKKPKYWEIKNNLIITLEQSQISNWSAGGYSNFAFGAMFKGFYNYHKAKHKIDNSIELAYGRTRQDISGKGIMDKTNAWIKNDDKIELNSIYGYTAIKSWNYSALMNIKSQFDEGLDKNKNVISAGLSPVVLTSSIGLEYKDKHFSTLFSCLTGKTTYVNDGRESIHKNVFGNEDWDKTWGFSLGSYIKLFYQDDLFKNMNVMAKLDFFYDYSKPLLDTDISGEIFVNIKVNKFLSAFFDVQAAIDKDFSTKLQYKERFGISIPLIW